jgi:hypothetical protein
MSGVLAPMRALENENERLKKRLRRSQKSLKLARGELDECESAVKHAFNSDTNLSDGVNTLRDLYDNMMAVKYPEEKR